MNEELKKKYQLLKKKNEAKVKEMCWMSNRLFVECIAALKNCDIINLEETEKMFDLLRVNFPMKITGCINWDIHKESKELKNVSDIYDIGCTSDEFFIVWDQKDIPCIRCDLLTILDNIDDVLAVSFDTWLLSESANEVIEFYHEGKITYCRLE